MTYSLECLLIPLPFCLYFIPFISLACSSSCAACMSCESQQVSLLLSSMSVGHLPFSLACLAIAPHSLLLPVETLAVPSLPLFPVSILHSFSVQAGDPADTLALPGVPHLLSRLQGLRETLYLSLFVFFLFFFFLSLCFFGRTGV